MKKDKILRKIVPSLPILARTPLVLLLDFFDNLIKKNHPEWQALPPASLRMRIGVGNKILNNHQHFINSGETLIKELIEKGYLKKDTNVLELGCGCGRNSIAFLNFLNNTGNYTGQDVDKEMIKWCQENLGNDKNKFYHADIFSKVYNPKGKLIKEYSLPAKNDSITLIVSVSVFSHLLYEDFVHYFKEGNRILTKGGHLHMTLFILDFMKDKLGDRWTFSHKLDKCYVEKLSYPEAAVAYEYSVVEEILRSNGFTVAEIYNKDQHQQTIIAKKI